MAKYNGFTVKGYNDNSRPCLSLRCKGDVKPTWNANVGKCDKCKKTYSWGDYFEIGEKISKAFKKYNFIAELFPMGRNLYKYYHSLEKKLKQNEELEVRIVTYTAGTHSFAKAPSIMFYIAGKLAGTYTARHFFNHISNKSVRFY